MLLKVKFAHGKILTCSQIPQLRNRHSCFIQHSQNFLVTCPLDRCGRIVRSGKDPECWNCGTLLMTFSLFLLRGNVYYKYPRDFYFSNNFLNFLFHFREGEGRETQRERDINMREKRQWLPSVICKYPMWAEHRACNPGMCSE